jgi:hypothetical protein
MQALSSSFVSNTTQATAFATTPQSSATSETPTGSATSKREMINGNAFDLEFVLMVPSSGSSNCSPYSSQKTRTGFILQPRRNERPNLYDEAVSQSLAGTQNIQETTSASVAASSCCSMTDKENEPSGRLGYDSNAPPSHQAPTKRARRAAINAELSLRHYPLTPSPPQIEGGEFPRTTFRLPNLSFLQDRSQRALQQHQQQRKLGPPLLPLLQ